MKKTLLLFITLIIATTAFDCGDQKKDPSPRGKQEADVVIEKTPKGVNLRSFSPRSPEIKNLIDKALDEVFADATAAYGYKNAMNHADYTVNIVDDCQITPIEKTLAFLINAPEYDGLIWDQNPAPGIGEVFAAEQVKQVYGINGWELTNEYIMCNDLSENGSNAARYGPEHILHYRNDRGLYQQTEFHGDGMSVHPLIPHRNQPAALVSKPKAAQSKTIQTEKGVAVLVR